MSLVRGSPLPEEDLWITVPRAGRLHTPEEIRGPLEAQEEPLRTLLLAAALTGMRQGELFGLPREDVDFEAHLIHVAGCPGAGNVWRDPAFREVGKARVLNSP